jgi:hypothetical protein
LWAVTVTTIFFWHYLPSKDMPLHFFIVLWSIKKFVIFSLQFQFSQLTLSFT